MYSLSMFLHHIDLQSENYILSVMYAFYDFKKKCYVLKTTSVSVLSLYSVPRSKKLLRLRNWYFIPLMYFPKSTFFLKRKRILYQDQNKLELKDLLWPCSSETFVFVITHLVVFSLMWSKIQINFWYQHSTVGNNRGIHFFFFD